MAWDHEFDDLLTSSIVVSTGEPTFDAYGVESWSGGGSTYRGRYVKKVERIRTAEGTVSEQAGIVWVASTTPLSTRCRIRIGGSSESHPVIAVERFPDEDGVHHHKVRLGWTR